MLSRLHHLASSLKARLAFASLVLIAASVALTVFLVLRAMEQRSQRAVLDAEIANVERIAVVMSSRLVSLQNALRAGSTRLPPDGLDDPRALIACLDSQVVLRSLFDSVFVASPQGRMLVNAGPEGIGKTDLDLSDRGYIRRTVKERRPVISQPLVSRLSSVPLLVLTMPVFDRQGELVAILGGGLRLTSTRLLNDLTRPAVDDHDPVTTIVTDSTGRIVSHPDPDWILKDARTERHFGAAVMQWADEGSPIEPQGSARRLGDDIVAVAGVPDADWVVFRSAPAEVLLGGPTAGRRQAMWIGAAVAVAGGLIMLLVTLALLRPLRHLERRALRLLTDDIAAEDGWPRTGGELGELARVFRHVMKERAASRKEGDALFEKMRAMLAQAPVGIAFTRLGRFELASAQFGRMFGYDSECVHGLRTRVLCTSDEAYRDLSALASLAFSLGGVCDEERELVRGDGSRLWVRMQGAPVRAEEPDGGTIWIFADITESRRQREHLSWTASHDELTGLVNRREFEIRLAEQLSERRGAEAAAALFIDLDRFKAVNDGAGHAAGDLLLKEIAGVLAARARSDDTIARIGGDEFAVLLRGCGVRAAERVAADLCARVGAHALAWQGRSLSVGASIGVVEIDASFESVEEVLNAADAACYAAKRAGRNAVRTHGAVESDAADPAVLDG